jgi:hypothetical protein
MPQVSIRGSVCLTFSGEQWRYPVMGLRPPFARVAAMMDMALLVERMEQI